MCKISAENIKLYHQYFPEKLPGLSEVIELCLNLNGGFALN